MEFRCDTGACHGSFALMTGTSRLLGEVPGVTPVATVGVEFHGSVGGGDLVFGCGQCRAFGGVFAFAADWAFGGVIHDSTL